ncbi:hypothetical protein ADUPG1_009936 [Aduncisulcus paluster]|uniref:Uncharacterized protein n=1 Tax=Aduncisulcus paluster TaxID=2918883 RepID=A0ABQ5KYH0_9EUKA|nr:hypothetical protein ADUPG1_009936 [Aduncisulcus paluster]
MEEEEALEDKIIRLEKRCFSLEAKVAEYAPKAAKYDEECKDTTKDIVVMLQDELEQVCTNNEELTNTIDSLQKEMEEMIPKKLHEAKIGVCEDNITVLLKKIEILEEEVAKKVEAEPIPELVDSADIKKLESQVMELQIKLEEACGQRDAYAANLQHAEQETLKALKTSREVEQEASKSVQLYEARISALKESYKQSAPVASVDPTSIQGSFMKIKEEAEEANRKWLEALDKLEEVEKELEDYKVKDHSSQTRIRSLNLLLKQAKEEVDTMRQGQTIEISPIDRAGLVRPGNFSSRTMPRTMPTHSTTKTSGLYGTYKPELGAASDACNRVGITPEEMKRQAIAFEKKRLEDEKAASEKQDSHETKKEKKKWFHLGRKK